MKARPSEIMRYDQGSAIVAVVVIESKAMYDAIQGGHQFGAGRPPDIRTQVQTPGLGGCGRVGGSGGCFPPGIERRGYIVEMLAAPIEGAMLSIAADTISATMPGQRGIDVSGKAFGMGDLLRGQLPVAGSKIKKI